MCPVVRGQPRKLSSVLSGFLYAVSATPGIAGSGFGGLCGHFGSVRRASGVARGEAANAHSAAAAVRETFRVRFRALATTAGIALCVLGFSQAVHADEAALARLKAMQLCANCHGPQGLAALPRTPHLAGQDQDYLVEQLKQYRNGRRHHEVMSVIAKTLSDQDIILTSSWYSSLRISVEDKN